LKIKSHTSHRDGIGVEHLDMLESGQFCGDQFPATSRQRSN
jgi:hypothetical protein